MLLAGMSNPKSDFNGSLYPPGESTFGGIVRLICLAVFRFMMNSNFWGCSTGRSPALAPLRIFST